MNERRQSPVAQAILEYLRKHPEARDTVEGVAEWWLPDLGVRNPTLRVKEALDELVAQGLISEHKGKDGQVSYRFTQHGLDLEKTSTR